MVYQNQSHCGGAALWGASGVLAALFLPRYIYGCFRDDFAGGQRADPVQFVRAGDYDLPSLSERDRGSEPVWRTVGVVTHHLFSFGRSSLSLGLGFKV